MIRRIFGLCLLVTSAWAIWQTAITLHFVYRVTGNLDGAFLDPVYLIPLVAGGLGMLGGVLAALNSWGGGSLGLISAFVFALFGIAVLIGGGNEGMWYPKIVLSGLIFVLAAGVLRIRRN